MHRIYVFAIAAIVLTLSACATGPTLNQAAVNQPSSAATTSCQRSKRLPPQLIGAARSGTGQQPVLVVGCAR